MAFVPTKDTKFSGTETLLNLTADAGGTINLASATAVSVPTVTANGAGTEAISDAALGAYVTAQLASYATTAALDAAIAGLDIKPSVRAATTSSIAVTAQDGLLLTLGGTTLTIDGVVMANGDRLLVKDSVTGASGGTFNNGIYVVGGIGSSVSLLRANDANTWAEIPGSLVAVEVGTVNADRVYLATADQGGTLGTTAQSWTRFGASTAADITNVPAGNIAATNVQTAINELDTEKVSFTNKIHELATPTAATPMGSQKFTGLGAGTTAGDSLRYEQLFNTSGVTLTSQLTVDTVASAGKTLYADTSISIFGNAADSQPKMNLSNNTIELGVGGSTAPTWSMSYTAADEVTIASGDNLKHDTEAAGANTTVVATTEFVQRDSRRKNIGLIADGSFPLTVTVSGGLPSYDVIMTAQTAAARAINLPAANALASGTVITVKDASASGARTYPMTVNRAGSDTIDGLTSDTIDTTSEARDYMSDGTSKWYRI